MGRFLLFIVSLGMFFPMSVMAQMNLSISQNPPPSCNNRMREKILPIAESANAVCRPEIYKSKNRKAKYALKRIDRWKKYAQAKWDEEHNDINEKPTGIMKPNLYPSYSYDRAVVYMYQEWAHECGRFNGQLADALLELSHQNERCEDTLAYESMRRMWRDNKQVQNIYENYGEQNIPFNETRGIATQEPNNSYYRNR